MQGYGSSHLEFTWKWARWRMRLPGSQATTAGERPLMGVVLGSTPYKLLHRSPVPVLVVRGARRLTGRT